MRKRFIPDLEECKPHYVGAAISAAIAAASIAAQQAQAAAQRRSSQNAAQAAKQGSAGSGASSPSVAGNMLGAGAEMGNAIKPMLVPKRGTDPNQPDVAGQAAQSLGADPMMQQPAPQMGGRGGDLGQGMQQAFGGQQPDLQQLLQQLQASGGMNIG